MRSPTKLCASASAWRRGRREAVACLQQVPGVPGVIRRGRGARRRRRAMCRTHSTADMTVGPTKLCACARAARNADGSLLAYCKYLVLFWLFVAARAQGGALRALAGPA